MNEILKNVADHIKENGLPDEDSMRADIRENERKMLENSITVKLEEYTNLFERFKAGEELSKEERIKMVSLAGELDELSHEIQES